MNQDLLVATLQKVSSGGDIGLPELIGAAGRLADSGQAAQAIQLYRMWLNANGEHPQRFVAQFNGAVLASQTGDVATARQLLEAALAVNPDFLPGYINLGGVLEKSGAAAAGLEQWNAVLARLAPITGQAVQYKLAALKQIARVQGEQQNPAAAEEAMAESLDINPHQREVIEQYVAVRMAQCKWPVAAPRESLSRREMVGAMHPLSMAVYTDDPLLQLAAAAHYVETSIREEPGEAADRRHAPVDLKGRRLRVGYVSSDLRDHAVGYLMAEVFALHDREKIEVFAYYCGIPDPTGLQARLKPTIEHWRDIRELDDAAAAKLIAEDEIDILVDVNGHTRDSRTAIFARRPAPIQVNWLGFPGTMGSPYHHYIIGDDWITPPGSEAYYSEEVVRLPCYQPNDRKRVVDPTRPTRANAGLPEDAFVFCCFNGSQKISRFTFERWLKILKAVPGSVLWLLASTPETHERLWAFAEANGVERARLVFAPKLANAYHLARYPLADLFLDTSPYGAHTTASDALWMGVPMITISGRAFASRVCGSLVRAAGLPELVVENEEDYIALAMALASDRPRLAELRARLQRGRDSCDLFNMEKLVTRLEGLYGQMVADHQSGRLPAPDLTNLAAYMAAGLDIDHEAEDLMLRADYAELYRAALARRHLVRPLQPDGRLWTGEAAANDAAKARSRRPRAS
ncbi:O-linked N-acetylglucosamine transferase, SPINDLY family protein [Phenylobacterium soli]|uniref:N-acetylglucosamine transferase n=1 Tax=Phenylobacterium soli TaxID=2170551 RepID=A0A328AIP4_9CAUL|nr:N-acetylglucosamine transferase [Phenylobacterium soli]RAK54793.1 N-acetylglucosamine transferase [Phenylobacterium soli]